jgi:predicted dinucleotide-binding enzyme
MKNLEDKIKQMKEILHSVPEKQFIEDIRKIDEKLNGKKVIKMTNEEWKKENNFKDTEDYEQ